MVGRPARALAGSETVGAIVVLAQDVEAVEEALAGSPKISVRPSGATIAESLLALCREPTVKWPIVVTTADHALLTPAMVAQICASDAGIGRNRGGTAESWRGCGSRYGGEAETRMESPVTESSFPQPERNANPSEKSSALRAFDMMTPRMPKAFTPGTGGRWAWQGARPRRPSWLVVLAGGDSYARYVQG